MTPAQHWARALAKFSPGVRTIARSAIRHLRGRMPGAVEFVYDNYNALVLGFGASERPSEAICSVVLYPKCVNLGFIEGAALSDPDGVLRGAGTQFRHVRLEHATTIEEPSVRALIDRAIEQSGCRFTSARRRRMLLRGVSQKQRPRRAK